MTKKKLPEGLHRDTLAVRAGIAPSQYGENSEALYLTSSFLQPDAETARKRFANEEDGYTYSRVGNPTVTCMEQRLAALEGTESAMATASGMAAVLLLGMGLLRAGDHVICSQSVFGSTLRLFATEFSKFGVQTTFVSQTDVSQWRAAVQPNTKLLFAETPTNPLTDICDIAALADVAHQSGALLAVDNCFCSPALQRPTEWGADFVIHSGTKYLDGQGRVVAGAICCTEKYVNDVFWPINRTAGMVLSPFNAWVVTKGMETLAIRMRAQCDSALALAQWLQNQPQVAHVYYPGLPSHPQQALAMRQQSGLGGAVVSFDVRAPDEVTGRTRAFHVIDSTQVCSVTTNLGDTKTTIAHPATTSHGRLTPAQRQAAGIGQGLIRIAVGLEHLEDLKADLLRGLSTLA
ncbi:O-succinylhomoserine sulfhydrylase [Rhodoferax sp.]|uniref:O-succinylhomoserine sulfhydrylase n=1 Tax=Rhodoferax sp. TaxID=50421 RepID=UPI002618659F|nr:O-succinylhomoserine sulfhydrylase [Rhodoferax sp.]MDD4943941.1 O-succinylhomoserine sulfhydrylase [Rhodoferax sp.]MDD5479855.1 O-succinylhomoserine sulfhydrylase [Rhodoferax sp.]